jgi:hypothetical protein
MLVYEGLPISSAPYYFNVLMPIIFVDRGEFGPKTRLIAGIPPVHE